MLFLKWSLHMNCPTVVHTDLIDYLLRGRHFHPVFMSAMHANSCPLCMKTSSQPHQMRKTVSKPTKPNASGLDVCVRVFASPAPVYVSLTEQAVVDSVYICLYIGLVAMFCLSYTGCSWAYTHDLP